jgi:hypothetical protein
VLGLPESFTMTTYRRKAFTLGSPANCVQSAADRLPMRRMQHLWLARANEENRPNGLPPAPPANSNAMVTRS